MLFLFIQKEQQINYYKIILNFKLADSLKHCVLNCISISVVNTLKRLPWKKIKIFDPGNEEVSLFNLIGVFVDN